MYSQLGQPIHRVTKQVLALRGKDKEATKSMVQSSPEFHKYRDELVRYRQDVEQNVKTAYQEAYAGTGVAPPKEEMESLIEKDYMAPAMDRYYEAVEEATYKIAQMQNQGLGDDEIEQLLAGFKIKKIFKKIEQKVLRPIAKLHAPLIGIATLGLVKPKALGFKSTSAQKLYKIGGKIGKIGAVVAGGYFGLPMLATAMGAAKGTTFLGALKFFGGKLVSGPKAVFDKLTEKGIDPNQATTQQALEAGYETGSLTDQMMERAAEQFRYPQGIPPESTYPFNPSQFKEGQEPIGTDLQPTESGMIAGLTPQTLVIGAGLLAIILFSGSPANKRR